MMQDVNTDKTKELKTIEIGQVDDSNSASPSAGQSVVDSRFGTDMSGSEEDEASEVDSFILDETVIIEESESGLENPKYLLPAETAESQGIQTVDPQTQARLEALLEAAGISKLSSKDGKAFSDPEVLRTLTSSVSSALEEAAQALHRMRDSQGQLLPGESVPLEAGADSESLGARSGSVAGADASEDGESLLSLACSAGYYELAQVLLAMKANVEDRGIKGDCTPLMEAASGGHVEIVRLLILHNADINAQSSAGNTPLHYGACGGFKDVVQDLLMHGASVEIHNENGHTPLMEAASAGHVDVAKILLDYGAGINTHSNEFKESALTLACYKGHLEMVKFLLEAGADQEHKTDEMHTALMEASMDGHVEVARLLLDSGAQVNMPADSFESPLTLAACGGHIELANLLIERGANIEEVNDEGYTPLMEAAREGHDEMVSLLLLRDADINAQTEETQETALTLACCGGFLEVADFLIRSGADIELGCSTPLMEAAQEGHLELVSFLLQEGANVHAQTGTGDTALTYACENGHTDVAEVLLKCGANLEHESEGGRTPLMKAARAGHLCTVQFLLGKGADVNRATSCNDHTVLSLACAGGHLVVVELLLASNADVNHKLKDGSTMVIEAAKGGHTQVVKLLLEWPNRHAMNSTADQLAQLNLNSEQMENEEEPRVPVQGLANIVPPSEPDSQVSVAAPSMTSAFQKTPDVMRQNLQKTLQKKVGILPGDLRMSNKLVPDGLVQPFNEGLEDKILEKDKEISQQASKEEQILRKQQILEELKKVEQELQEKAQAQMQAKQQNENLAKLLDLPSQSIDQINDFAKILAYTDFEPANTEAYLQQVQAHLQQHQQQQLFLPQVHPNQSTPASSSAPMNLPNTASLPPGVEGRNSGKVQGNKRNGNNKQARAGNKQSQSQQQLPPPPPPPPPPPQSMVQSVKVPLLLPSQQQALINQTPPVVFQTEHDGISQSVEVSQIVASTSQMTDCNSQAQPLNQVPQPLSPVPIGYSAPLTPQHDQLLMFSPHNLLNHQTLGLQQLQMGQLQPAVQGANNTQLSAAPPPHLSHQQQHLFKQQQEQAHALLHQQLQLNKTPVSQGAHTIALNKPQGVSKNKRVMQTVETLFQQNAVVNSDVTTQPAPVNQSVGMPTTANTNSLYSSVDVDSQTESNHDTALTLACAGGHSELVSLLLAKGADIEHRDKKGFTPLILASTAGHVEVVEILLEHRAEIEAQSERTKDTPLSLACSGGRYEVVELLLTKGANKEHRNVSDYTPLSLAASGGYVNIIKLLLTHNAEINSRTGSKLGISPLMLAAMNGHTAAVKLLLDMGSDINAQIETNRNTALTLACFQGRHEVVSLLVDRKANIEHRAKTGLTPLMEAASGGYVEVGRVLLNKGADVNAPPVPSSRDTALTIAADKGHYRFVELLLHRGAAVDVKNKKGNSPLWLACNGGHNDVVSLLVQADADIDSQDNRKVSCLMAAFRRGHLKVVKWMVKKVTQFPSESEIKRFIAGVTDKELQKKCNQCSDVIVTAKDRQALEANKNADSLLEQIEQEKEQAALKAEVASRRRERRRERKKKGKNKEKNDKEGDSGKNSSPEPEGDSSQGKKDEDEEEEEDDDDNSDTAQTTSSNNSRNENKLRQQKGKDKQDTPAVPYQNRCPDVGFNFEITAETNAKDTASNTVSSARANNRESRKNKKASRESRREANLQENKRVQEINSYKQARKDINVLQVTIAKVTTLIETVTTITAMNTFPTSTVTHVTNSSGQHMHTTKTSSSHHNISGQTLQNSRDKDSAASVNGGGSKSKSKKSNDIIKQSSTTGIGDLDDFGVRSTVKNSKQAPNKKSNADDKKELWDEYRYIQKLGMSNRLSSSAASPRKSQKKEEGWKEVVRKNMSKKLSVPANVIARLIGKNGCNINAIREMSGAHVEVEKAKGNADRTVTIKGFPDAIKQANNLINAMVDEPDKDVLELLARGGNKTHKVVEKVVPPPAPSSKVPVSITDFAIGTFSVPVSSHSSSSSTKSPAQSKSSRQANQGPSRSNNPLAGTIGAWQNPVPRQAPPSSPRRSPQKQVLSNNLPPGAGEKSSSRQLVFERTSSKQSSLPTTTLNSNLAFTTGTTMRNVIASSTITSTGITRMTQDPRLQTQIKTSVAQVGNSINSARFPRPQNRMEPLPIVTSSMNNQSSSGSSQQISAEYSPFSGGFTSFLSKKEEPNDKMDFASVAAAGVVSTGQNVQTTTTHVAVNSLVSVVDPLLQAKAPGYKLPPRGNSPPNRQEFDQSNSVQNAPVMMGNYRMLGAVGPNIGMRTSTMNQQIDPIELQRMLQFQNMQNQMRESGVVSNMSPAFIGVRPMGMMHGNHSGIAMPHQASLAQKEEYSKPHRPMTLPEIKGALNPNAPEFQLPGANPVLLNGIDRAMLNMLPGAENAGFPRSFMMHNGPEGSSPNNSPNPGAGITGLNAGSIPSLMQSGDINVMSSLQQQYAMQQGQQLPHANNSAARLSASLNGGLDQSASQTSPPQGIIAPPGLSPNPGSQVYMGQNQHNHSGMQAMPAGRPNSAPIQPEPGPIGIPPQRGGSPMTEQKLLQPIGGERIQPIGGERKRGSTRGNAVQNNSFNNIYWNFTGTSDFNQDWNAGGTPVMTVAAIPSSVITSSVVSGSNMVYPHNAEVDDDVIDYGMQHHSQFKEPPVGMPGGDGDHSLAHTPGMMMPTRMLMNSPYGMNHMFPGKGGAGDSQAPLWSTTMARGPPNQTEDGWQPSWSQQAEI